MDTAWQERLEAVPRWCGVFLRRFQQSKTYRLPLLAGGLNDQPVRWLAACDTVEDELRVMQDEQAAQEEALGQARRARGR